MVVVMMVFGIICHCLGVESRGDGVVLVAVGVKEERGGVEHEVTARLGGRPFQVGLRRCALPRRSTSTVEIMGAALAFMAF